MLEGKRISELEPTGELFDGCCFPVVTKGRTKKVTFATLVNAIEQDLPETDVDEIKQDVATLKTHANTTDQNINELNNDVDQLEQVVESVHGEIESVKQTVAGQNATISSYGQKVDELEQVVENTHFDDILELESQVRTNTEKLNEIEPVIPAEASAINKLVDKDYVDNLVDVGYKKIAGIQNFIAAKKRFSVNDFDKNNSSRFATFLHITDIHGDSTRYLTARKIADFLGVNGVLMTGDVVVGVGTDDFSFVTDNENNFNTPLYTAIGNHDHYGLPYATEYNKYYAPFASRYGYTTPTEADGNNELYYVDIASKKIRIISLSLYGYVDSETVAGHYPHYTQALLDGFAVMLARTPKDYGAIVICHSPEKSLNRSYKYDLFKQPDTFFWTDGSGYTALTKIVDAYISKTTVSGTHTNTLTDNSTVSYSYDFSGNNHKEGAEFICWVTGHTHSDNIAYVPNTTNKQLMLNMACSGLPETDINFYNDLAREVGTESESLLNGYIIDRENKTVKVIRIGAHLTYDLIDRNYMIIPYAD